jgi:ATP-dependent helicase/nuclease subunit B
VTVLVPNNIAGLFVRRHLAHGLADGQPGIAGVFISTLPRLAEQLAAASLHPRAPTTATVVAAAWRSVLQDSPGVFASVADHPATIRALTAAHRELRDLSDAALDAVASAGPCTSA